MTATTGKDNAPGKGKILIARNDGSGMRVLANGDFSSVSPDDSRVAVTDYDPDPATHYVKNPRLEMFRTSGGAPIFKIPVDCYDVVWAPNSQKLACVSGGIVQENPNRLLLIDATTGAMTTLATGFFDRPSFSPDSKRLVYVQRATGDTARFSGTLKIVDLATRTVTSLRGSATHPVWGPSAIAFSVVSSRPRYDVLDVALIQPDGSGFRQITHIHATLRIFAVFPVAFSSDGTRLLGGVYGQDAWTARESYAIDPIHGGFRLIAHAVMPSAFSKDGKYVIGQSGDPECCGYKYSNIVRVPWARGGKRRVLIRHAMVASYNG